MAQRKKREASPPEALATLGAELEREGLAKGYVLRGDEPWFLARALDRIVARAKEAGHEITTHDGRRGNPDFTLSTLLDDLSGSGLFASERCVIVRNADEPLKKTGNDASPLTRAVKSFVEHGSGTVVLACGSLRLDHAAAKAIVAAGGPVLSLRKLWDSPPPWKPDPRQTELVQWFLGRARAKGVRLDAAQAVYVCAATGNDLAALDDQLERIKNAPGDALRSIVGWDASAAPWTVADRFVAGEWSKAVAGTESLFSGGFQEKSGRRLVDAAALANMLIAALMRGVRQAQHVAEALAARASDRDLAALVGGRPQAVEATVKAVRSVPLADWRRRFEDVLALERRLKSGGIVDGEDFVKLTLRWNKKHAASAR